MERKIGETFEFKGKTYEVAELPDYFCAFCDLEKECYSKRSYLENVAGTCSPSKRMDTRNVCFKEIKKDMEIKDNQLTINIPYGMEIDLQNSNFDTGVIKFRKKELTYEDIRDSIGKYLTFTLVAPHNGHKIFAINTLMDIAKYYNGDWKPDWSNNKECKFYISYNFIHNAYFVIEDNSNNVGTIVFKRQEDAQAVIDNPNFREILDAVYKN